MSKKMKIILLAGNTLRARAYAQQLAAMKGEEYIVEGVFFGFSKRSCSEVELNDKTIRYFKKENIFLPDLNQDIRKTFKNNHWCFTEIETEDVNSEVVLKSIHELNGDIVVFAGYGGQILNGQHFEGGRKYLHMHPGELPTERGSTTVYYSILNNRNVSVTAFFMTADIDAGENIHIKSYPKPFVGVDLDCWFDCGIRADCFKNALVAINKLGFKGVKPTEDSEEYYVIHPVLKHIAILSLKEEA
jgi:methionyl-tRNA formyltransferase